MLQQLYGWLIIMAMMAFIGNASVSAHVHGISDQDNEWLARQGSALGVCCTGSEALTLVDPDWCIAYEGKCANTKRVEECKRAPSQTSMTPGSAQNINEIKYCVHFGHTWWAVPENAVVKAPNRIGPAIVWPIFADINAKKDQFGDPMLNYIRCFLVGAET